MIQRRYFDEDTWQTISDKQAANALGKFFTDPRSVIQSIRAGDKIITDVAMYRLKPNNDAPEPPVS